MAFEKEPNFCKNYHPFAYSLNMTFAPDPFVQTFYPKTLGTMNACKLPIVKALFAIFPENVTDINFVC